MPVADGARREVGENILLFGEFGGHKGQYKNGYMVSKIVQCVLCI